MCRESNNSNVLFIEKFLWRFWVFGSKFLRVVWVEEERRMYLNFKCGDD